VGELIDHLKAEKPQFDALFGDGARILAAVNQDMATPETPVSDTDEVAFFPPMTGG
jgi:molybdopterin converting factor small subunit